MASYEGGQDIRERTFQLAVRVVNLCKYLDDQPGIARVLAHQLIRSGTSVGANLEEAKAGTSRADFIAKCDIALKESRETHYWLRLLAATDLAAQARLTDLLSECDQVSRILGAIVASGSKNRKPPPHSGNGTN